MEQPDLDAYPILRLDQLSIIDVKTLEGSLPNAKDLMKSLVEETEKGGKSQKSMIKYLRKQLDETVKELARREAEDRVNALLTGTKKLLVKAIPPDVSPRKEEEDEDRKTSSVPVDEASASHRDLTLSSSSSKSATVKEPPPVAFYKPIPLPSQLVSANNEASRDKDKRRKSEDGSSIGGAGNTHQTSNSAGANPNPRTMLPRSSSEVDILTSRSSDAIQNPPNHNNSQDQGSTLSLLSTDAAPKETSKRRPRSGNSAARSNQPKSIYSQSNLSGISERQRQLNLQQNFGNSFVVGATEKRKRFVPKKKVVETAVERREKMREKGRQQAMIRLLERKNKQIERNEEMKLRRMEEKSALMKKRKEDAERKQQQLEKQRLVQRERQREIQRENERKKEAAMIKPNEQSNSSPPAIKEDLGIVNDPPLSEVDHAPSSDDESLSGDDELTRSVVIPQTEVDSVAQESVAVFDSYRKRNMAMRIDSDSDVDDSEVKRDDEATIMSHNENIVENKCVNNDDTSVEGADMKVDVTNKDSTNSMPVNTKNKNLAALSKLRQLKSKKNPQPDDTSISGVQETQTDLVKDIEELPLSDATNKNIPGGNISFDNFQCEEGVEDILFVDKDGNGKQKKPSRLGGACRGHSSGLPGNEVDEGEEDEGGVGKKKRKKKKKKREMTTVLDENGEEVMMEVEESDKKKKKKKKVKKVKRIVVNEDGEEVEIIEVIEVRPKSKKKKSKRVDDEGDHDKKEENDPVAIELSKAKSNAVEIATGSARDLSAYTDLNSLFCSFFLKDSVFSIAVDESGEGEGIVSVHTCAESPDSLPGLSAWVLTSIDEAGKAEWSVDMTEISQHDNTQVLPHHANLLKQRALLRKEASYGLVLLARVCESMLLGIDYPYTDHDETLFRNNWQSLVAQFDCIVADLSKSQQDTMFHTVDVCGNMSAVVSKLENLVKGAFVHPPGGYSDVQELHEANRTRNSKSSAEISSLGKDDSSIMQETIDANNQSPEGDNEVLTPSGSASDSDSLDESAFDDDSDDEYMDHFSGAIDMLKSTPSGYLGNECVVETNIDDKTVDDAMKSLMKDGRDQSIKENVDEDSDSCTDGYDDESMMLPDSSVVFVNDETGDVQPTETSKPPPPVTLEASTKKSVGAPKGKAAVVSDKLNLEKNEEVSASRLHQRNLDAKPPSVLNAADKRNTSSGETTKKTRDRGSANRAVVPSAQSSSSSSRMLSDVYKSIAEIFPAVRAKMDSMQAGCRPGDHAILAKILLESMHVQSKVYSDWLEVMDDYATVFSHDKEKGVQSRIESDDPNSSVYSGGSAALHYRVKSSRPEVNNIIKDVFSNVAQGWEELPTGLGLGISWNILWSWSKPKINMTQLLIWQRVNHFQNSKELTRKDALKKNLQKFSGAIGNKAAAHFEIMPQTFLLPTEYTLFVKEYSALEQDKAAAKASNGKLPPVRNMWIVKPVGLSRGRGISMLEDLSSLTYSQSTILQKYVDRPLCLDDYKFDLRIYVVVTSFQPLEAFVYRDGFARVSTVKYSTDEKSLSNLYIHLTNSSIQKNSESGPSKDNPLHISQGNDAESNGSKIGLQGNTGLWKRLEKLGCDVDAMWESMCLLIVKSLVAVDDKIQNQPCSFELFGYDVLFDENFRPWLIEVNSGPSLARENQLDIRVKNELISDIIKLIDPAPFDRAALTRVLRQRINDLQKKKFSMTSGDPDLERHLKDILGNHIPRRYGEEPKDCGNFERLCPGTRHYSTAIKLKGKIVKTAIKK